MRAGVQGDGVVVVVLVLMVVLVVVLVLVVVGVVVGVVVVGVLSRVVVRRGSGAVDNLLDKLNGGLVLSAGAKNGEEL